MPKLSPAYSNGSGGGVEVPTMEEIARGLENLAPEDRISAKKLKDLSTAIEIAPTEGSSFPEITGITYPSSFSFPISLQTSGMATVTKNSGINILGIDNNFTEYDGVQVTLNITAPYVPSSDSTYFTLVFSDANGTNTFNYASDPYAGGKSYVGPIFKSNLILKIMRIGDSFNIHITSSGHTTIEAMEADLMNFSSVTIGETPIYLWVLPFTTQGTSGQDIDINSIHVAPY
jgi:hypothetical protein